MELPLPLLLLLPILSCSSVWCSCKVKIDLSCENELWRCKCVVDKMVVGEETELFRQLALLAESIEIARKVTLFPKPRLVLSTKIKCLLRN